MFHSISAMVGIRPLALDYHHPSTIKPIISKAAHTYSESSREIHYRSPSWPTAATKPDDAELEQSFEPYCNLDRVLKTTGRQAVENLPPSDVSRAESSRFEGRASDESYAYWSEVQSLGCSVDSRAPNDAFLFKIGSNLGYDHHNYLHQTPGRDSRPHHRRTDSVLDDLIPDVEFCDPYSQDFIVELESSSYPRVSSLGGQTEHPAYHFGFGRSEQSLEWSRCLKSCPPSRIPTFVPGRATHNSSRAVPVHEYCPDCRERETQGYDCYGPHSSLSDIHPAVVQQTKIRNATSCANASTVSLPASRSCSARGDQQSVSAPRSTTCPELGRQLPGPIQNPDQDKACDEELETQQWSENPAYWETAIISSYDDNRTGVGSPANRAR